MGNFELPLQKQWNEVEKFGKMKYTVYNDAQRFWNSLMGSSLDGSLVLSRGWPFSKFSGKRIRGGYPKYWSDYAHVICQDVFDDVDVLHALNDYIHG